MKTQSLLFYLSLVLLAAVNSHAQLFPGTNSPGQGTNYTFTLGAGATNLSLVISNSATTYSYLLLKAGGTPTDTTFDFASRLTGQTNEINLELPEFATGSYGLRVSTPATSTTQPFTVVLTTNRSDLRSAGYPVLKPLVFSTTGSLTNSGSGAWQYFQVDVPSNLLTGWRIVLSSTNAVTPGLYIRRNQLPTTGSYDKAIGPGQPIDTIIFTSAEATNGTYFIGVYQNSGTPSFANFNLSAELASITTLTWDPGTNDAGTQVFTNHSMSGGDYYFAITTQNTADQVWRTVLNVFSNQASLYLLQGSLPSTVSYNYASTSTGSNGLVLAQTYQFAPGQNWYLLVHATPGAQWTLLTGEAYVQQLPALAADGSSGATAMIGAEGMRFFKTTITSNTLAWRLGLNGLNNQLYVRQTAAPHPYNTATYDLTQPGQMLVVPTYLNVGSQYFVGVAGSPGLNFTLDSRQQVVTNLAFGSATNFTVTGYGYTTFLVQVPVQQIAWQINVTPLSGNANVAVRQNNVPNEFVNDAFSEPPAGVGASVTLVPSTLSNGSFYLTVYGTGPYSVTLTNGQPIITPVDYVFNITNDAPGRVGWRFYSVTNTAEQLGSQGWELDLSNQVAGTMIAIRRNAVPGQWNYRNNPYDYTGYSTLGYVDLSSTLGYLQQPNHQADIWYIGIYTPAAALGNFVLTGSQLTGTPVSFDGAGSSLSVTNQPDGKFQYFTVTVPPDALGWDLRLTNVTGNPQLYICHDQLPPGNGYGWSPPYNSAWLSDYDWTVGYDWTSLYYNPGSIYAYGQVWADGVGDPLSPGTYYVGVYNYTGTTPLSYTLLSHGIGGPYSIPVTPIAFSNGVASVTSLAPRGAAYYSVTVPSNMPNWRVELDNTSGESRLLIQKGALPCSQPGNSPAYTLSGGRLMAKPGDEQYFMMPQNGQSNIVAGTYYLTVVSEGMNPTGSTIGTNSSGFTLSSFGPVAVTNLGIVDPSGLTDLVITNPQSLAGQFSLYNFSVPANTLALEVFLTNTTGSPVMLLRADSQLPNAYDGYGNDGGQSATWYSSTLINIASPPATNYTLMVQAQQAGGNAGFTVHVHAIGPTPVAFDGGSAAVTNQPVNVWQYFTVTVPPDALGWDLRLTNVTGNPQMFVCFQEPPPGNGYGWSPPYYSAWFTNYNWTVGYDWTSLYYNPGSIYAYGQVWADGMGDPLSPGSYYVGVYNYTGTTPLSYTLLSQGIGGPYSIPVTPIAFSNGIASVPSLPPRGAAYYSVTVPSNMPNWKVRLSNISGESLLLVQKGALPCSQPGNSPAYSLSGGRLMTKPGNEQYLLLPQNGQSNVVAGTYYLTVTSEGMNPASSTIGTNSSGFTLTSYGVEGATNFGTVGLADILQTNTLQGGENALYGFNIPGGVPAVEVRLDNVTGGPYMTLATGTNFPAPYYYSYGVDGGASSSWSSPALITLPNPTSTNYALTVQASANVGGTYLDAIYTVHIRQMSTPALAFDASLNSGSVSNIATGTLLDGQSAFYQVTVPSSLNGQPVIGWKLDVVQTTGTPNIRVRQGLLPDSYNYYDGTSPWSTSEAITVPPYLTPGVWYVEIKGTGITSYTLTSSALQLKRPAWTMQAVGAPVTTAGLPPSGPLFADTGVDTNGVVLPGDQGTDLAQGKFDYYAITVPASNTGVLRTRLDAISGNPNLYIRAGAAPTLSHYQYGQYGNTMYDRTLNASGGSEYGNWVPLNGRFEFALTNGTWYLAVQAGGGSNVRYRLRMDTGNIQPLSLNGGSYTSQSMVAGDYLYYAVQLPTNSPVNWNISYSVQLGNVQVYVRDRVPPGQATTVSDYRDWSSGLDNKNHGPYPSFTSPGTYTLTCPPLRPGNTYYLGFRAISDSTLSLSCTTNGGYINYTNVIPFYNGFTTTTIPAFGAMKYRVDVPGNAVRWIHFCTNSSSVWLYLDQGSVPTMTTADDWYSINTANSTLNVFLQTPGYWPWQPGYSYFLIATNTSASPQPFTFVLNGEGPLSGPFGFNSVTELGNGTIQLNMQVVAGLTYQLQTTTNLLTPWTGINTFTPVTNIYNFIDTTLPLAPARFYRLQEQ